MMRRLAGLLGGLILAWPLQATWSATNLPAALDLRQETSIAAKAGGPLIVIYSRADCKYCEAIKRDFLLPLTQNPRYQQKVTIRQINQDGDNQPLTDFKGKASTHAQVAAAEKVKLVPVVAFYGPDGRKLADPIVGARLPDFYQTYLEDGIEQSMRNLQKP